MNPDLSKKQLAPTTYEQVYADLNRICHEALAAPTGQEERAITKAIASDADARARIVQHPMHVNRAIKTLPAFKELMRSAVRRLRDEFRD